MELQQHLEKLNKKILDDIKAQDAAADEESELNNPTDPYQNAATARLNASEGNYAIGSRPKMALQVKGVLRELAKAHDKAKDDSDVLRRRGDLTRAKYVEDQYMEDYFLPAVEALVLANSADELLNNKEAISELDKYASLDKVKKTGYTTSFIKSMHSAERGQAANVSDNFVIDSLRRIRGLIGSDNIRAAVGVANKTKTKIDSGKNLASKEDYETLQNIVLRGQH